MLWFSLWFVLITVALVFLALLGRWLFGKAKAVTADLAAVSDQLAQVTAATRASDRRSSAD